VDKDGRELSALVTALAEASAEMRALAARNAWRDDRERYLAASARVLLHRERLANWVTEVEVSLLDGEPAAANRALSYLEADLYYFGSGYAREHLARTLAHIQLNEDERARARAYVLRCIDGELHCKDPGRSRLARAAANDELRRELRARLHAAELPIAVRAARA
jgi:hypothetical protein